MLNKIKTSAGTTFTFLAPPLLNQDFEVFRVFSSKPFHTMLEAQQTEDSLNKKLLYLNFICLNSQGFPEEWCEDLNLKEFFVNAGFQLFIFVL